MIFWIIDYFYSFKKAEFVLPSKFETTKKFNIKRVFFLILGLISWSFITYSLMGPRKPAGIVEGNYKVNDIFFVVDVSRSMLAEDFKPNRLEAAKVKIREFVKLRPKDRIGIIIFSERVFTLLPLSTDLNLIDQMVSEIKIGFLGSGTNIGDALGLAVGRASQSLAENKVIVLLTDGVSNVGTLTPTQAAEIAKEKNIKVYTIAIGSKKGARLPVGQGLFGKRYQNIPGGSVDYDTLKKISETTGASHFVAEDNEALREVLGEIEKLERTEIKSSSRILYKELYLKYLFLGALFLCLTELGRKYVLREVV